MNADADPGSGLPPSGTTVVSLDSPSPSRGATSAPAPGAADEGRTTTSPMGPGSRLWATSLERAALPLVLLLLVVIFSVLRPTSFATTDNAAAILGAQAVLVVVALGLLVPLRCGDFDLSVGGTLTLATMIVAVLNGQHGLPLWLSILAALAAGAAVGAINGFFVIVFGINSFIVTIGIGTFLLGVVSWLSDNRIVSGIDSALLDLVVLTRVLGIPLAFYYALALCLLMWFVFERTATGRRWLFVGAGRDVARLSGIKVDRNRWGALITSGAVAALAGVLYAGTTGSADPRGGVAYLLPAFAAAFLGATSIQPGQFNPFGTLVAAYFLLVGITGLQMLGAEPYVQDLFYGGALVLAVALSQLLRGRRPQELG
ncbi:ABC transporter permease [Geodermatophilus ruber]|uniref:Monosaccharide ABC transporter membrane protein, CUT2 family n=1 Tax=Geodermatophilus ruber TaxID=504800 RepID=A0A1I4KLC9_9ACTN|nr:ABC transporter permease [Geodermatophilus ruber]SFL79582.1 monosaccharide ABC transporter membrane protein, CUT2 family [Geodermatophilus ruber]